jgi:hypothetical protein
MKVKIFLIFLLGISMNIDVLSQKTIIKPLKIYFEKWEKGISTVTEQEILLKGNVEEVISEAERFVADTSASKRYAAYHLLGYLGAKIENKGLRKRAIKQLIFGSNDKDGGIAGNCFRMLTIFDVSDFDTEAKYLLGEMAKKPRSHYEILVKICGWLDINDLNYDFRRLIEEKKGSVHDRWFIRLAMARMGEKDMIDYVLDRIENIKVNDDVVYELIPDVVYVRQKVLFDYLLNIIESDDKECNSSNPDSDEKIICAYRVIEQVAPYIENFPAKVDIAGELISNNYNKTLEDVRIWIKQNSNDYKLKSDLF